MTTKGRLFFHRSHSVMASREADIVDLGDGTVLRRLRGPGDPAREALATSIPTTCCSRATDPS